MIFMANATEAFSKMRAEICQLGFSEWMSWVTSLGVF